MSRVQPIFKADYRAHCSIMRALKLSNCSLQRLDSTTLDLTAVNEGILSSPIILSFCPSILPVVFQMPKAYIMLIIVFIYASLTSLFSSSRSLTPFLKVDFIPDKN